MCLSRRHRWEWRYIGAGFVIGIYRLRKLSQPQTVSIAANAKERGALKKFISK